MFQSFFNYITFSLLLNFCLLGRNIDTLKKTLERYGSNYEAIIRLVKERYRTLCYSVLFFRTASHVEVTASPMVGIGMATGR
jgi:hypothetical protein